MKLVKETKEDEIKATLVFGFRGLSRFSGYSGKVWNPVVQRGLCRDDYPYYSPRFLV